MARDFYLEFKKKKGIKKRTIGLVAIKRKLRKLGCTGWKPNDSMKKLKSKLRTCE